MNKIKKIFNLSFIFLVALALFVSCGEQGNKKEPCESEHTWGEWSLIDGQIDGIYNEHRVCELCDEEETRVHEHTWGEWHQIGEAFDNKWTVSRTCDVCDSTESKTDSLVSNIPSTMVYRTNHRIELSTLDYGTIKNYEITTSNRRIVAVDSSGKYLEAKNLGEAVITVIWGDITLEYTIKVVDAVTIDVDNKIPCLSKQTIICKNAQGKEMPDATLVSSNESVIKVNSLSEIEALSEGTATLTLTWGELTYSVEVVVVIAYYYDCNTLLHKGDSSSLSISSSRGENIENYEITSSNPDAVEIIDKNNYRAINEGESILTVTYEGVIICEIKVVVIGMKIYGKDAMNRGELQILNVSFTPSTVKEEFTAVSDNEEVVKVLEGSKLEANNPGIATITITTNSGLTDSITITVKEVYYTVTFDISDEDRALLPEGFIDSLTEFCYVDLPISLPELSKDEYAFLGWSINGRGSQDSTEYLSFEIPTGTTTNVKLETCWGVSRLELGYTDDQILEPNESTQLSLSSYMIANNIDKTKLVWFSDNETVAKVSNSGVVTGINEGNCLITVYLEENQNISTSIGITVMKDVASMSEVINYFLANAINRTVAKNINVTGYQFNYSHKLLGSVTNYLFEKLVIDETSYRVPIGSNRPGDVNEKYYVVVHDTASSAESADARAHGRYVAEQGGGGTSWHYSVGNDGIYHHIPDNERAYHAGDGSRPYHLNYTGIPATNKYPKVTITLDGYYALDDVKTPILAPTNEGKILTTDMINDEGIRVVIKDGYYYIGDTYYNDTYKLISNTGGNKNSIGMETMVNKGSDIFYTWHKTAQLVSHLVKENNLTLDDVKPHHYFSGKNCPQTMREAGMWKTFLKMVECEYMMITKYADYELSLSTNFPEYISTNGRIIKQDAKDKSVSYTITFTKDGQSESVTLWTVIPGYRK